MTREIISPFRRKRTTNDDVIPKIRVPHDVREALKEQAAKEHKTLSEHIRLVLTRLVLMEK